MKIDQVAVNPNPPYVCLDCLEENLFSSVEWNILEAKKINGRPKNDEHRCYWCEQLMIKIQFGWTRKFKLIPDNLK